MYHRFNENKYPSTNIQVKDFKEQLQIIKDNKINFINSYSFTKSKIRKKEKESLFIKNLSSFVLSKCVAYLKKRKNSFYIVC